MRALFFDTVTTGLPKERNKPASLGPNNWPEPVSISWAVTDGPKIIRAKSYLIQPQGWQIPQDSIRIHGITQQMAEQDGVDLRHVMKEFVRDLLHVDIILAHNLEFDKNVIIAAALYYCRDDVALKWPPYEFCTCENSRSICKLSTYKPSSSGFYKSPKLTELYMHAFKTSPPEILLHTSLGDVLVLVAAFFKIWTLEQVASYGREGSRNQAALQQRATLGDSPNGGGV
jgi:DNA polymerase III epsilon subunit-like protein